MTWPQAQGCLRLEEAGGLSPSTFGGWGHCGAFGLQNRESQCVLCESPQFVLICFNSPRGRHRVGRALGGSHSFSVGTSLPCGQGGSPPCLLGVRVMWTPGIVPGWGEGLLCAQHLGEGVSGPACPPHGTAHCRCHWRCHWRCHPGPHAASQAGF